MDCSYGFRPKRSCHKALKAVNDTIMFKPVNHVIEADIKGFFDNVSHYWMMTFLQVRIRDSSLLLLIRRFLKAGYIESGSFVRTEQGTAQGGNLSPILANIFLHYVLNLSRLRRGLYLSLRIPVYLLCLFFPEHQKLSTNTNSYTIKLISVLLEVD